MRDMRPVPQADPDRAPTAAAAGSSDVLVNADKVAREGSREERQQLVDRYTTYPKEPAALDDEIASTAPTLQLPGWDKRLAQLGHEVKPQKKAGGFLGTLGKVVDVAGKALDAPAEGLERLIGMAYWNEVPLSDRWEMGRWTYDSIWADVFGGGGGYSEAVADYKAGKSWDAIEQENQNELGNLVAHFVLDPTWLIGGAPLVGHLPVPGAKFAGEGLNFAKVPGLRSVPVIRSIGKPVQSSVLEHSIEILSDTRPVEAFNAGRVNGGIRRLFELTPQAKVDQMYTHITNVTSALNDPRLWDSGAIGRMFDDLTAGRLTHNGMAGLEGTTPVKQLRALFQEHPDLNQTVRNFESLRNLSDNAFWGDATGVLGDIVNKIRSGTVLTPEEGARYGAYRSTKFMEEFSQKGLAALYDVYKLPKKDLLARAESLSGAMKTALSMVTINTPSFVVTNFVNNASSLITKLDDPVGSANFLSRGLTWFKRPGALTARRLDLLDEMGFSDDLLQSLADDTAFYKELTGGADEFLKGDHRVRRVVDRMLPFVKMASKTDDGMRITSLEKGAVDAAAAVWHTGNGGVQPTLTPLQRAIPGLEDWVDGLKFRPVTAVDELSKYEALSSDELVNAGSLLSAWAKQSAPSKFGEAAQAAGQTGADSMDSVRRMLEAGMPDGPLAHLDDLLDSAREARRSGVQDYMQGFGSQVDEWADEFRLAVEDQRLADRLPPRPLDYSTVRPVAAPWHDAAEFSRLQANRQELYSRLIASHHPLFGGEAGARAAQEALRSAIAGYRTTVRGLIESFASRELSTRNVTELFAAQREALLKRNSEIAELFKGKPQLKQVWENLRRAEVGALDRMRDTRLASLADLGSKGAAEAAQAWSETVKRTHLSDISALERTWQRLGLEAAPDFLKPEYLTNADLLTSQADDVLPFLDFVKTQAPDMFRKATPLTTEQLGELKALQQPLREAMYQRNLVMAHHGRAVRDFVALNYAQKRGFDSLLALVFPYHFWIGRTARDWMRMTMARPGQSAAMVRLFQGVRDINTDAGLPDRLKNNIRIPVPWLDTKVFGQEGSMYFDPIRLVYPLSGFQDIVVGGQPSGDATATHFGQMFEFASNLGVGINPFMTLGLGATGSLGDRYAYLQRGLASVRSLPFGIPGPRVFRSASDWLAGIAEDPDPEYLTPEVKAALANGEPLPENVLREAFQSIADMASTDGFDGYRADRMVASLVGADPERWTPRDGLEALRYHRGPLWQEAVRQSKKEKGLRVLTGWGLMPVQAYPEGEQVMRGLDAIWREVRDQDDPEATDKFFQQHPEYQVRRISIMDREDPAGQRGELDTALFFLDLDKVEQRYDSYIDEIEQNVRKMEELGYLQTKEGRRMRSVALNDIAQLNDLKQGEISQLEALYPNRSTELSLRASPHERALFSLREQYFNIQRKDFKSDDAFRAARQAFLDRLPDGGDDAGASAGEWMQLTVRSIAVWNQASDEAAARPGMAAEIIARRDEQLRKLTDSNVGQVTRQDFDRYLAQGKQAPTQNKLEYQKASDEMAQYMAISEAPGLTETTKKEYKRSFWQTHPLLEKYYGRDEPKAWNAESAATYARMDDIWTGYYDVEGDARAQRDYLALNLEELNGLRLSVGLYPLRLLDWQKLADSALQRPLD